MYACSVRTVKRLRRESWNNVVLDDLIISKTTYFLKEYLGFLSMLDTVLLPLKNQMRKNDVSLSIELLYCEVE